MGAVRMVRMPFSLSMRFLRVIAVNVVGRELEQRHLVAELYLLPGFVNMHNLVDDLEQCLVVVSLVDFLWLAPAPIKENLCGRDARHRRIGFGVHDADEHADGRAGV